MCRDSDFGREEKVVICKRFAAKGCAVGGWNKCAVDEVGGGKTEKIVVALVVKKRLEDIFESARNFGGVNRVNPGGDFKLIKYP